MCVKGRGGGREGERENSVNKNEKKTPITMGSKFLFTFVGVGIELRVSHMLSKYSATELYTPTSGVNL